MTKNLVVGWDTETRLITPKAVFPRVVCVQTSIDKDAQVVCQHEKEEFEHTLRTLVDTEEDYIRVAHSSTFDLGVLCSNRPEYVEKIFDLIERGKFTCTRVREKLLNLSSHGQLDFLSVGDTTTKIRYSLADLVMNYFGVNLKENKATTKRDPVTGELKIEGDEDAWRLNYAAIEDMAVKDWPEEAITYAADDAVWTEAVYFAQEKVREQITQNAGHDPFETLDFQCSVDFAMGFMQARGVKTDPERVHMVIDDLKKELTPDKMRLLIAEGILQPEEPPRPYANGARDHEEGCVDKKSCDCPLKMTCAQKEKINTKKLHQYVERLCKDMPDDFALKRNPPSDKFPEGSISVNKDWLTDYAYKDGLLEEYAHRQRLQKLVTTEIPRMMWEGEVASVVHPNFDVLKATGRTSSFAGNLYPSFNCQNVDPRVRRCFIPRAGYHLFSIDYSAMELGTFAQTCIDLFGYSKLADTINAGRDPHAYLGSQIAYSSDEHFRCEADRLLTDSSDPSALYDFFKGLAGKEDTREFFKKFRTFAKPTGLGYPGGLGVETFRKFAKGTYGVEVDKETAQALKDIWLRAYPEAVEFFKYVNAECVDNLNGPKKVETIKVDPETGESSMKTEYKDRYRYESPMGMHRMACDYCACCNGMGMQTPSAEGAKLGLYEVIKASVCPSGEFYGKIHPLMFIHDEIVGEIKIDTPKNMTALLSRVEQVMVDSMRAITPDVRASAESVIMTRWDKYVDPAYDSDGNLVAVNPDD